MRLIKDGARHEIPTGFSSAVVLGGSGLWSNQNIVVSPTGENLYAIGGLFSQPSGGNQKGIQLLAADSMAILKEVDYTPYVHPSATQLNGGSVFGGDLFIGANNYPETPKRGWVYRIPANLSLGELGEIVEQPVRDHWCEGGAFRPHTSEFWVCYHDIPTIDRYDASLGRWELTGSFDTGLVEPNYFQSVVFWSDRVMLLPLHLSTGGSSKIAMFEFTGTELLFLRWLDRPHVSATQGFDFSPSKRTAYFAGRETGGPGIHKVIRATVDTAPFFVP